ncbi:MAG: helix-turn-helix transcriptional regulator [Caldicoprobacterales bacterium]
MLSERIKKCREEAGYTQQALADILGITQQAGGKWEVGKAEPDSKELVKLAEIFDVSLDYLLGRTNIKKYNIETIATHHDGEDWTEEELEDIKRFKEFVRRRKKSN